MRKRGRPKGKGDQEEATPPEAGRGPSYWRACLGLTVFLWAAQL